MGVILLSIAYQQQPRIRYRRFLVIRTEEANLALREQPLWAHSLKYYTDVIHFSPFTSLKIRDIVDATTR